MIADASLVLRKEAEFRFPTLHYHQDRIYALQRFLSWSGRRVRSIYNKEDGVALRGEEALRIEELKQAQRLRKREEAKADDEDQALAARLTELEAQVAFLVEALARAELAPGGERARRHGGQTHIAGAPVPGRRSDDRH
jgi:hypothetical protein